MKQHLEQLILQSVKAIQTQGLIPSDLSPSIQIEYTRDKQHGDFACNIALLLAKPAGRKPREIAEALVQHLPASSLVKEVQIAGPGFINFFMVADALHGVITKILADGANYGCSEIGKGRNIHIEYVSSNPTGPLHVGHGRSAAYGAAVVDLLRIIGCHVHREYYVNDAGRQMNILATSLWLRYLETCGEVIAFPKNGYQGDYVKTIAAELFKEQGQALRHSTQEVFADIPADIVASENKADENACDTAGDTEAHIDGLIARTQKLLGDKNYRLVLDKVLQTILTDIKEDLAEFGVHYEEFFSERSLKDSGAVNRAIEKLRAAGHIYEQAGALWFKATAFGDEKDRVVVRENGQETYFGTDIAYHMNKFERGFNEVIDVVGADHHGYVPRITAVLTALGYPAERFKALIVQFATLYRGNERVQMSTRSGSFVTLRELREEVGNDAARFFYVMRKSEQHMDFDLELAKSQSQDNPVYYIQYAHARIASVFRQLSEKNWQWDQALGEASLHKLDATHEQDLLTWLSRYSEVIETAALQYEPHILAHYLRELAQQFHTYYNAQQFLVEDAALRNARLCLIRATQQVFVNGLQLLGVSAPDTM